MSSWPLKTIVPFTVKMDSVLLWLEVFISVSEVTLKKYGNGCKNNEGPTAVS